MSQIGKPLDASSQPAKIAFDYIQNELRKLAALADKVKLGGGEKNIAKQHEKGKLTARERIQKLIDPGTEPIEVGLFAAHGMYQDEGGAPSAGVVVVLARVSGRLCVI